MGEIRHGRQTCETRDLPLGAGNEGMLSARKFVAEVRARVAIIVIQRQKVQIDNVIMLSMGYCRACSSLLGS